MNHQADGVSTEASLARRQAGIVLLHSQNRIALIEGHRGDRHLYVVPGGGIEPGETPEAAAKREAKEERGLEVRIQRELAEVRFKDEVQAYYLGDVTGGRFGAGTGDEMNGRTTPESGSFIPVWFPTAKLPQVDGRPAPLLRWLAETSPKTWPEKTVVLEDTGLY